jgi:SAM-dependent methyltransferase
MKHIDECLYFYRLHGDNSYLIHNAKVQNDTTKVRTRYLHPMVIRWADSLGLPKVDLGAAHGKPSGFIGVDIESSPDVDKVCDVSEGLPFDDSSVGIIRAMDFLEHIPDSVGLMNEIYRVLVDGGWLLSGTPSTDGRGAFQDPTHVSFFNQNNFWYYTNKDYADYVPGIRCRFQAMRVETYFPTAFHKKHDIPYVYADLSAIKSNKRRPGRVLI